MMDPLGGWGWAGLDWTSRGNWATQALQHLARAEEDGRGVWARWISVVEMVHVLVPFQTPPSKHPQDMEDPDAAGTYATPTKCAAATGHPGNE